MELDNSFNISIKPDNLTIDEWCAEIQVKYDQGYDYEAINKYYIDLKKPKNNTEYSQMIKNKWKKSLN
jgi:hypothetical protein